MGYAIATTTRQSRRSWTCGFVATELSSISGEGVDAGQFSGECPQPCCLLWIDCVGAHAGHVVIGGEFGDVAVFAVDPAEVVECGAGCGPDLCRGTLFGCLQVDEGARLGLRDEFVGGQVPGEVGRDAVGVDRKCPDALWFAEGVEMDGEQAVGGLGLTVSLPFVVSLFEMDVFPTDSGNEVPRDDTDTILAPGALDGSRRLTGRNDPSD